MKRGLTIVPPQKSSEPLMSNCRYTIHGHSPLSALVPPSTFQTEDESGSKAALVSFSKEASVVISVAASVKYSVVSSVVTSVIF